jgi:uncharacterized repeat protein (TIGR01451 family)
MSRNPLTLGAVLAAYVLIFGYPATPGRAALEEEADLSVNVEASAEEVLSGSNVTYTVEVTNRGAAAAAAFDVVDELPSETTFVSCAATGGAACVGTGNTRSVSFGGLAPGASVSVTLVAAVSCAPADGTEVANIAEVHPLVPDPGDDEVENETVFVNVRNPPPVISGAAANPSSLWPPNHQWINVGIGYTATDNCGPVSLGLRVVSSEPVNGTGDGDTAPDWQVVDAHLVRLRAERAGNGNGRTYTITISATDSAGQTSTKDVTVAVPKNQKK